MVSDIDDRRDAPVTEIGSVYGPPPTRNSADGGDITTWPPPDAPATPGVGAGVAAGLAAAGAGGVGTAAVGAGWTAGAPACPAPAGDGAAAPVGAAPATGGAGTSCTMTGGGPCSPRFCCVPTKIGFTSCCVSSCVRTMRGVS